MPDVSACVSDLGIDASGDEVTDDEIRNGYSLEERVVGGKILYYQH